MTIEETARTDALFVLLREARSERASSAGAARVNRACKTLAFTAGETLNVMRWLEFVRDDGTPYNASVKLPAKLGAS